MQGPRFTSDWFSPHISFWEKIFERVAWDRNSPKLVVVVGSYEGRSTIWTVENLLHDQHSKIICIDTFEGSVEHSAREKQNLYDRFHDNIAVSGCAHKVEVCRGTSAKQLSNLIARGVQADFVYIDGSHQAPDVLTDAVLAFNILKPNGIMIFDDYVWTIEPHGSEDLLNSPKISIDIFSNIFRRKIRHLGQSQMQMAFIKQ